MRIWEVFGVFFCGKGLLFIILKCSPYSKRNINFVHVLALHQLFGTVIQETAGGVSWPFSPASITSRDGLQWHLRKGRAEWMVCSMFNVCHLKMENPGNKKLPRFAGNGWRWLQTCKLWNLQHLLEQLIFVNDHSTVFTVFCGHLNQWPRWQAVDVAFCTPVAVINSYVAIPLRESWTPFLTWILKAFIFTFR